MILRVIKENYKNQFSLSAFRKTKDWKTWSNRIKPDLFAHTKAQKSLAFYISIDNRHGATAVAIAATIKHD